MKYTFKCEQFDYDPFRGDRLKEPCSIITIDTEQETLSGLLEQFEAFLRASGFQIDGYLDIVPHDEMTSDIEEIEHSKSYFDTERNK